MHSEVPFNLGYLDSHEKWLTYEANKKIRKSHATQKDKRWWVKTSVFFNRKKNRRVAHKCYDTEQYVEDAGWNVCYEKFLRIVKTDTCKVEAGLSFVHGLHDRKKLSGPPTRWSYHQKLIMCKVH